MEQGQALNSSANESFLSKFQKAMNEMEVEKSGNKMKKRKRSEDSGLDTSDYEVNNADQSGKKRKSEEETETSTERSVVKRKKNKKKKKKKKEGNTDELRENSTVEENDVEESSADTGSGQMVETRQPTPSQESDSTPIQKTKRSLLSKESAMFEESAEETDKAPETPGKRKKERMEREEVHENSEVTDTLLVSRKSEEVMKEDFKTETESKMTEVPGVTINELYRMPKQSKVSAQIFSACKFIMEQQVEVSLLNRVYRGHCVPKERSFRKELRRKYNAKFGNYNQEEDEMIIKRFRSLISEVLTEGNPREFLQSVLDTCCRKSLAELHESKFRTIGVRNIIGLYVGQDIPNKIAFIHFCRLIKLAFKTSPLSKYVPVGRKVVRKVNRIWTAEDHNLLLRYVLSSQKSVTTVEEINLQEVDWDDIAASNHFGDRTGKNLREHFQRSLYSLLVEELDATSLLEYRRNLLTAIVKQGAHSKQTIDWGVLESLFWPKTRAILQLNFTNIIKGGKDSSVIRDKEDFDKRVSDALAKIEMQLGWPEQKLEKFLRSDTRQQLKLSVREQFHLFVTERK